MPPVADGVRVVFLDPAAPWAGAVSADPTGTVFEPGAAVTVQLVYDETRAGINHAETYEAVIFPLDGIVDPADVITADHDERDFIDEPPPGAAFSTPDVKLGSKAFWNGIETDLRNCLVANRPLQIWRNEGLRIYSRVDESEKDFRMRCAGAAEEAADSELAELKDRLQKRIDRVKEEIATAETRYQEADAVAAARDQETVLGTAGDLLGAFLGGKSGSTALNRAASRQTASAKARAKADTAAAKYHSKVSELEEIEQELASAVDEIVGRFQDLAQEVEIVDIPLEKSDVRVAELKLVWIPTH
jgi:hypothetical protein